MGGGARQPVWLFAHPPVQAFNDRVEERDATFVVCSIRYRSRQLLPLLQNRSTTRRSERAIHTQLFEGTTPEQCRLSASRRACTHCPRPRPRPRPNLARFLASKRGRAKAQAGTRALGTECLSAGVASHPHAKRVPVAVGTIILLIMTSII